MLTRCLHLLIEIAWDLLQLATIGIDSNIQVVKSNPRIEDQSSAVNEMNDVGHEVEDWLRRTFLFIFLSSELLLKMTLYHEIELMT